MKKLLFVLALGAFAACGGGTSETNTEDTTTTTTDTSTVAPADTTTMPSDTGTMDTTHADTAKNQKYKCLMRLKKIILYAI